MLTFNDYFGGLDRFNLGRGRFEAFFVYNRATTRGDLWERLKGNSSNDNAQAILRSIPTEGRPGNFWTPLLSDPMVSAFPGVKVAVLEGFSFFPDRRVVLSVGVRTAAEMEGNATEAEIRDACLSDAKAGFARYVGKAETFLVTKKGSDSEVVKSDHNRSLRNLKTEDYSIRAATLKMGKTGDGGYSVIIGGVIGDDGKLENHGRWLPYPMLVPMMVGTAMSVEKDYYSSDAAFDIGRLSQQMLQGGSSLQGADQVLLLGRSPVGPEDEFHADGGVDPKLFGPTGRFRLVGPSPSCAMRLSESDRENQVPSAQDGPAPPEQRELEREIMVGLENNRTRAGKEIRGGYAYHLRGNPPVGGSIRVAWIRGELSRLFQGWRQECHGRGARGRQAGHGVRKWSSPAPACPQTAHPPKGTGSQIGFLRLSSSWRKFPDYSFPYQSIPCSLPQAHSLGHRLLRPDHFSVSHLHRRNSGGPKVTFYCVGSRFLLASLCGLITVLALEPTLLQTPRERVSVAGSDF